MFDHLRVLADSVTALASGSDDDLAAIDGAALGDALLALDDVIRRLEAVRLQVTRAHSRSMAWKRDGARSPVQWHRDRRRLSGGRAAREVDTAHGLDELPRTAAAVASGDVTVEQAAVAARARRGLTAEQVDQLDVLVADRAPQASDRQLRDAVADFAHETAPDDAAARERQAFDRRGLHLGRSRDGGWWIDGRLDVVGGEQVAAALSTLSAPRGEDDQRSGEQRRADALAGIADRALRADSLPAEGGRRPQIAVTTDIATLEQRVGAPAGRAEHGGAISSETVRQLACDAIVHRVITRGASEVLDVGRGSRTVSVAQRRALAVRDGGCVGCDAPVGWTDAHHVVHWADGGGTDMDNLVLLCRSCHTGVHHRGWRIVVDPVSGRRRVRRPGRSRRLDARPRHGDAQSPARDFGAAGQDPPSPARARDRLFSGGDPPLPAGDPSIGEKPRRHARSHRPDPLTPA